MEGMAQVLRPLNPGEWPTTELKGHWSWQPSSPWPHHIECLTLAATGVLMCAELYVIFHTELLTLLQHDLGSMPTRGQQDQVVGIANQPYVNTCHMAAHASFR